MLSKTIILLAIFALSFVPSDFHCVNSPDVCPATTQPRARYCSYCGKPLYMSITESRIADQLPFYHQEDSPDEVLDHFHDRIFSDQPKEASTPTQIAKEENITMDTSNIANKGVENFEEVVDPSSDELIVGDNSKMSWQNHTDVPIEYLADYLATSDTPASPPNIADAVESEMSGFPIEAEAKKNVYSSSNIDKNRQPDMKMENVSIALDVLSNPLETTTTSPSNNIKKEERKRTKKRNNKKSKRVSNKVDEPEITKMLNDMVDILAA